MSARLHQSKHWHVCLASIGLAMGLTAGIAQGEEFIVKLKPADDYAKSSQVFSLKQLAPMRILDTHAEGRLVKIDVTGSSVQELAENLKKIKNSDQVEYITPNIMMHAFDMDMTPNDPRFAEQWSHKVIHSEKAWDITTGSEDVVVAVIDTGVDYNHPDLAANIWTNTKEIAGNKVDDDNNGFVDDVRGWDFFQNDNDPMDITAAENPGHGTHCAGIIGAVGNNGQGVAGISHKLKIMPVRFLNEKGQGDLMVSAKAIDYAVKNGAKIISASWGAAVGESMVGPIVEAIDRANKAGVMFVVAAANDGKSNDTTSVFPANTNRPNVISVAATDSEDHKPQWSNFGERTVHIGSPGHKILSTLPDGKYGDLSGTSMATPLVAGSAALLLAGANNAAIDGWTMRSIMQTTGTRIELEVACHCRIDMASAMDTISKETLTVVPNTVTISKDDVIDVGSFGGTGAKTFSVENAAIAKLEGTKLTGLAIGQTTITVTDAAGKKSTSGAIKVAEKKAEAAQCPLQDPMMCMLMCLFDPAQPWCAEGGMPGMPPPGGDEFR